MNKLLLIEPPFYRLYGGGHSLQKYPLALGALSGIVLQRTDWTVQGYNADFDPDGTAPFSTRFLAGQGYDNYLRALTDPTGPVWDEVTEAVREFGPDVVGISSKTQNFASVRIVASLVKRVRPSATVVVGGPHPSMVGAACLECPDIDIAVAGEGEETLVELLTALRAGADLAGIAGISYRTEQGIIRNPPRGFIQNLDELPFPHAAAAATLRDYEKYPSRAFKYIFALRGCPYGCEFCGSREIWSRKVRYRSPANVVKEIKQLMSMGLRQVHFDDDTFGVRKDYTFELCRLLKEECPGLTWSCELTVNLVTPELVAAVRAAGCTGVQIGVESGNNEVLRKTHKNITIEKAFAAAKMLKGLWVEAFFMAGFPYETEETLMDTWRAIREIDVDAVIFSVFTPYPGTDAFEVCRQHGLVDDSYDVSLYNHQSPKNCFTPHIAPQRFHEIVSRMMQDVDRKNQRSKLLNVGRFIREHGVIGFGRKAASLVSHRIRSGFLSN